MSIVFEHDGCVGCKYESEAETNDYCKGCKQNAVDKYTKMTNFDRIKDMSVDEMAEFIEEIQCESANCGGLLTSKYVSREDTSETVLEWLESGVVE